MRDDERAILRLGHSPDPDDAFMWWPLFECDGKPARIDTGRFRFQQVLADIETLNQRSASADLEITAMSCAQYPFVKQHYAITACGASMGDHYGPKLVSRIPMTLSDLKCDNVVLAVPGERTSGFAMTTLMLGKGSFRYTVVPFDQIIARVHDNQYAAGLIIHEGQLTFEEAGLHLIADVGQWWSDRHQLPLPLGINAIRRDLNAFYGAGTLEEITASLRRSIEYALANRQEAIEFAMHYARDMGSDLADEFINLYVNQWTLDLGMIGHQAIETFLNKIHSCGLTPGPGDVEVVQAVSHWSIKPASASKRA